jgi:hypothetical protein
LVVSCIAIILALTGSAFAAKALITGSDIKDGSITKADLSNSTVRSLKGKRGPAGKDGQDGFAGGQGPQGSTGPEGPRGPQGPAGAVGPKGNTGDTGVRGPQGVEGPVGPRGPTGDTGPAGQAIANQFYTGTTPLDVTGTGALPIGSTGPDNTQGVDLTGGAVLVSPGQYIIHVGVSFINPDGADARAEYGVARLFLSGTPLDGVQTSPTGGSADADTTMVTADIPDDRTTAAQVSGTYILNVTDDGVNGGEFLTLRAAALTDGADRASATAHFVVTRVG